MKFVDRVKDFVGIEEEEYYLEDNYQVDEEENYERPSRFSRNNKDNVVEMHKSSRDLNLVLVTPTSFDKVTELVEALKNKKPIIVNLEELDQDTANKVFYFLNGAILALGGGLQKISSNIFVFVPANVSIDPGSTADMGSLNGGTDNIWK